MDTFTSILAHVPSLPSVVAWAEPLDLLGRGAVKRPRCWELPVLACEAVGGRPGQAIPAAAPIECLQTSLILIDDLLDEDPRGEHCRIGAPAAANLAATLQSAALEAVARSDAAAVPKLGVIAALNRMGLATAHGQHLDTLNPGDEEGY